MVTEMATQSIARAARASKSGSKAGRINVNQLMALDQAYGRNLTKGKIFKIIAVPGVWFLLMTAEVLFDRPFFGIPFFFTIFSFFIGCYYGYRSILPKEIEMHYQEDAYAQRNAAINILTQSLMDPKIIIPAALDAALENAEGEFRNDLFVLEAVIVNRESNEVVHDAFKTIINKYSDDVSFGLFFEQIETAVYDGIQNYDVFVNIKDQHNDIYHEYLVFIKARAGAKRDVSIMKGMVLFVGGVVFYVGSTLTATNGNLAQGLALFSKAYSKSMIGIVACFIFLLPMFLIQRAFDKRYYDSSVTDV